MRQGGVPGRDQTERGRDGRRQTAGDDPAPASSRAAQSAEVAQERVHRRIAILGRGGEASAEDLEEWAADAAGGERGSATQLGESRPRVIDEWTPAEQRLVEAHAECELIDARVDEAALDLLGRHVRR